MGCGRKAGGERVKEHSQHYEGVDCQNERAFGRTPETEEMESHNIKRRTIRPDLHSLHRG
jgi:hypothetical protein